MASSIISGIYPPLVSTYNPVFISGRDSVKIYFSLSDFNNKKDLKEIHISLVMATTNVSVLKKESTGATNVLIKDFNDVCFDETIKTDYNYYIVVPQNDLEGLLIPEIAYKAQLRFSTVSMKEDAPESTIAYYIFKYYKNFSEWSTITIVRSIYYPTWENNYSKVLMNNQNTPYFNLNGRLKFLDYTQEDFPEKESCKDFLTQYRIQICYPNSEVIHDSGLISTSDLTDANSIAYNVTLMLADGRYLIKLYYKTDFGYENVVGYDVLFKLEENHDLEIEDFGAELDEENGCVRLNVAFGAPPLSEQELYELYQKMYTSFEWDREVVIYRSSLETNFEQYEEIHRNMILKGYSFDYVFYDKTAQAGEWYKYAVRQRQLNDDDTITWGALKVIDEPILIRYDYAYLVSNNKSLKLKYDVQINSFSNQINESVVNTLGGRYPFIIRNGDQKYKQFNLSGTISAVDNVAQILPCHDSTYLPANKTLVGTVNNEFFISKQELYGTAGKLMYDDYNSKNNITILKDKIYEKKFRDVVMDFLCDGSVKLFKSESEGNILVRLTNVSFTPNNTLGRMIYNFSATAIEVDECSLYNYDIYKVQNIQMRMINQIILEAEDYKYLMEDEFGNVYYNGVIVHPTTVTLAQPGMDELALLFFESVVYEYEYLNNATNILDKYLGVTTSAYQIVIDENGDYSVIDKDGNSLGVILNSTYITQEEA